MLINEINCMADGKSASDASSAVRRVVVEELQNDPQGKGYSTMTATEVVTALMAGSFVTTETDENGDTIETVHYYTPRWIELTVGLAYASNAIDAYDISTIRSSMQ